MSHAGRRIAAVLLAGLATTGALATNAAGGSIAAGPQAGAASLVAEWVADGRIPGAVLLITEDGRVVTHEAFGAAQIYTYGAGQYPGGTVAGAPLRRMNPTIPMSTDTVFDLASVTKVMATTFATMLLVDDGVLALDAPVSTYLDDFEHPITIRQLLTHRSGLSQWQPIYYDAADSDAAYRFIRDFPLAWQPGTERHYSDLGFMLLGLVIEEVSGQGLGNFLQDRLYESLGLDSVRFMLPGPADPKPRMTAGGYAATSHGNPFEYRMVHDPEFGYRIDGDADRWTGWRRRTLIGEVNDGNAFHAFGGEAGHAGLFGNAADLQVLLQLLLSDGELGGRRWISAETISEFLRDTGDGQALGWQVPDYLPEGSFNHTGFTGTYVAGVPAQGLSIVLLTNRQNVGVDAETQYPNISELQRAVATAAVEGR